MGNLCGKQSKSENFSGEGRVLGAAPIPAAAPRAPVPSEQQRQKAVPKVGGPARTLGGSSVGETRGDDPKAAAARAAEERANRATATGKLGKQLEAQRKQTRTATLEQVSQENRAQRDADAGMEARNWN
ncbi:hypothetical protein M501DRAFT_998799 [Patellaria atrata CBS 101060]|uniref:Uncharacterized protein n=1 Tax=Patellaria atrata CBS 101060 TaxID=1346257 RepID=A0A9P4SIM2_9PEZI|nr:hypothetical protein M501DRAFT_998799 [Patellaria atrata CBS 101060]